jgi:hypothetical protein
LRRARPVRRLGPKVDGTGIAWVGACAGRLSANGASAIQLHRGVFAAKRAELSRLRAGARGSAALSGLFFGHAAVGSRRLTIECT